MFFFPFYAVDTMAEFSSRFRAFIFELRRRKVIRVGLVYIVLAWVIVQVVDATFEHLPLPKGSATLVIVLLMIGFPLALALAWAYEFTPGGLKRDLPESGQQGVEQAGTVEQDLPEASIAVLPFMDMSPDRDQGYFCDGVAEEILTTLTRVTDLHVASRTSSFRFKGQAMDIADIARKLRVRTVLEGSVRKAHDKLRITAQLIDAATGFQLWSARYDRGIEDIFSIQDEIARNIAEVLEVRLAPCKCVSTQSIDAYEYYLQGWNYFHRVGPKNMEMARHLFSRAIELDPAFAKAWAGLADSYGFDYLYYNAVQQNLDEANRASKKALELAPELAETHTSRAFAHSLSSEFGQANKEFEEAIRINPNLFEAYYLYARSRFHQGKLKHAAELFEQASRLRPLDYQSLVLLSRVQEGLGNEDLSLDAARRAVAIAEKVLELQPDEARALYLAATPMMRIGRKDDANKWIERALFIEPDDPSVLYNVACFYAQTGKIDKAVDCLERATLAGMANKSWIQNDSDLDPLRNHVRFKEILEGLAG
jgi:TolB-like protein/Flp pilus assembly protein TadD